MAKDALEGRQAPPVLQERSGEKMPEAVGRKTLPRNPAPLLQAGEDGAESPLRQRLPEPVHEQTTGQREPFLLFPLIIRQYTAQGGRYWNATELAALTAYKEKITRRQGRQGQELPAPDASAEKGTDDGIVTELEEAPAVINTGQHGADLVNGEATDMTAGPRLPHAR